MPNSEYLRLKALLDSNPQYKIFLNSISKAEGTWGKDAYSTTYGGGKSDWKKGKDQTVRNDSSAHGKYQFMNETWKGLKSKLGLEGFSPEEQDIAALKLAEEKNALKHIDDGNMEQAFYSVSGVWAAIPKDASGKSALTFKNGKAQPAKSIKTIMSYAKSNESARAEVNDQYKSLNEKNAKKYQEFVKSKSKYPGDKIKNKVDSYWKEITNIQAQKISDEEKNLQKHAVKQKYYREGYMSAINVDINERNKEYNELYKEISLFSDRDGVDRKGQKLSKSEEFNLSTGAITKEKFEDLKKKALKFNIDLGNPEYEVAGGDKNNKKANRFVTPGYITKKLNDIDKLVTPMKMEPGILKYGKTKDEYDEEVSKSEPVVGGGPNMPDATTGKTKEELDAKAKKNADEAKLLAEKNKKPYDGTETLKGFKDPGQHVDTQFQYTPGKQKFPLDSLIGLTTGLMGAAAADSVDIKYRDEQIAEGMLQYAQDIAKIKNMGLDPAIEGSLKQKLADGYQTGLENIVRASNGNRNLVLGNQGQLDQARMKGIVDIVAMDVDRSDKALAAFGEVQKYINDFETNKSIANNERKYQEDQKKQMAGMQLASAGMSNFIDSIQASKENAPGSINDMKRQWFQFQTTGILPNAKEGEPGSLSYKMKKQEDIKIFNGKVRTYADWINSKNKDDQNLIAKILDKNPQMNPLTNKAEGENATRFEDVEKMFDDLSGNEESKKAYLDDRGISDLDVKKAEAQKVVLTPEQKAAIDENKKVNGVPVELQAQKKINDAEKVARNGSNIPITMTKQQPQQGSIVGTTGLADGTMLNQLLLDKNGQPTGPATISDIANQNAYRIQERNEEIEENK